jgi:hypothetical protein
VVALVVTQPLVLRAGQAVAVVAQTVVLVVTQVVLAHLVKVLLVVQALKQVSTPQVAVVVLLPLVLIAHQLLAVTVAQVLHHPFQAHQLHTLVVVAAVFMPQQDKLPALVAQVVVAQVVELQVRLLELTELLVLVAVEGEALVVEVLEATVALAS